MAGWLDQVGIRLSQLSTKLRLKLKLKLSLAKEEMIRILESKAFIIISENLNPFSFEFSIL